MPAAPTSSAAALPCPVLIGDIGGTHARFAIVPELRGDLEIFPIAQTSAHASVEDAIEETVLAQSQFDPKSAVLAVAGPVRQGKVRLTNADWVLDPLALIDRFQLSDVVFLNDFEALTFALPALRPTDYDPIGEAASLSPGVKVVVGPGTGLGAAALIPAEDSFVPVSGEGGHMDFAPRSERDREIWPWLAQDDQRISAENLISGPGLLRLYQAVCGADGVAQRYFLQADITAAALAGTDPQAVGTLDLFTTYLGRYAGDLAILFMARGGVYLAGGVTQKIAPFLKRSGFRAAFEDKAPHQAIMADIATVILTHPAAALAGLAAFVRQRKRFLLNLAGRHWQA